MNLEIVHNLISTATITISKPSFHGDLILGRGNNKFTCGRPFCSGQSFLIWTKFPDFHIEINVGISFQGLITPQFSGVDHPTVSRSLITPQYSGVDHPTVF